MAGVSGVISPDGTQILNPTTGQVLATPPQLVNTGATPGMPVVVNQDGSITGAPNAGAGQAGRLLLDGTMSGITPQQAAQMASGVAAQMASGVAAAPQAQVPAAAMTPQPIGATPQPMAMSAAPQPQANSVTPHQAPSVAAPTSNYGSTAADLTALGLGTVALNPGGIGSFLTSALGIPSITQQALLSATATGLGMAAGVDAANTAATILAGGAAGAANTLIGADLNAAKLQSDAAITASQQQVAGNQNAINTTQTTLNNQANLLQPGVSLGNSSMQALQDALQPGGSLTQPFQMQDTQAYRFARNQALQATQNAAAKGGTQLSGGTVQNMATTASNIAGQQEQQAFNQWLDSKNMTLQQLQAGIQSGQVNIHALNTDLASAGVSTATLQSAIGQNKASGTVRSAQALAGGQVAAGNASAAGQTNVAGALAAGTVGAGNILNTGLSNIGNLLAKGTTATAKPQTTSPAPKTSGSAGGGGSSSGGSPASTGTVSGGTYGSPAGGSAGMTVNPNPGTTYNPITGTTVGQSTYSPITGNTTTGTPSLAANYGSTNLTNTSVTGGLGGQVTTPISPVFTNQNNNLSSGTTGSYGTSTNPYTMSNLGGVAGGSSYAAPTNTNALTGGTYAAPQQSTSGVNYGGLPVTPYTTGGLTNSQYTNIGSFGSGNYGATANYGSAPLVSGYYG